MQFWAAQDRFDLSFFANFATNFVFAKQGKTSLLRVLNGQCKNRLASKSQVYLSRFTTISTCFVAQVVSDHLMSGLTARQSLIFASKLKNQSIQVNHVKLADAVLAEFNLTDIAGTKVENCSGKFSVSAVFLIN